MLVKFGDNWYYGNIINSDCSGLTDVSDTLYSRQETPSKLREASTHRYQNSREIQHLQEFQPYLAGALASARTSQFCDA